MLVRARRALEDGVEKSSTAARNAVSTVSHASRGSRRKNGSAAGSRASEGSNLLHDRRAACWNAACSDGSDTAVDSSVPCGAVHPSVRTASAWPRRMADGFASARHTPRRVLRASRRAHYIYPRARLPRLNRSRACRRVLRVTLGTPVVCFAWLACRPIPMPANRHRPRASQAMRVRAGAGGCVQPGPLW